MLFDDSGEQEKDEQKGAWVNWRELLRATLQ